MFPLDKAWMNKITRFARIAALTALIACQCAPAFYLPGIAPVSFPTGSKLEVMANKLTSVHNQLSYDYNSLPFCSADDTRVHKSKHVSLSQLLAGERTKPTNYILEMQTPTECNVLCTMRYGHEHIEQLRKLIWQTYRYVKASCSTSSATRFTSSHRV
jgi:transmembrane 9 superfamily member 2/4